MSEQKFTELKNKLAKIGNQSNSISDLLTIIDEKYETRLKSIDEKIVKLNERQNFCNDRFELSSSQISINNNNVESVQELMQELINKLDNLTSECHGNSLRLSLLEKDIQENKEKAKAVKPPVSSTIEHRANRTLSLNKINKIKT